MIINHDSIQSEDSAVGLLHCSTTRYITGVIVLPVVVEMTALVGDCMVTS